MRIRGLKITRTYHRIQKRYIQKVVEERNAGGEMARRKISTIAMVMMFPARFTGVPLACGSERERSGGEKVVPARPGRRGHW